MGRIPVRWRRLWMLIWRDRPYLANLQAVILYWFTTYQFVGRERRIRRRYAAALHTAHYALLRSANAPYGL